MDEITAPGQQLVEMLVACAEAPDDLDVARAADAALRDLELSLAEQRFTSGG